MSEIYFEQMTDDEEVIKIVAKLARFQYDDEKSIPLAKVSCIGSYVWRHLDLKTPRFFPASRSLLLFISNAFFAVDMAK